MEFRQGRRGRPAWAEGDRPYTLEITLKGPREYFPLLVGYASALPAHKASVDKFGDKWTEPENIVSNGPFKLTKWEHNKALEFERNEDFAIGPKPKLEKGDRLDHPYNAGLLPYESGELDWREPQGIPASEIPRLQGRPGAEQATGAGADACHRLSLARGQQATVRSAGRAPGAPARDRPRDAAEGDV